MSRIDWWKSSLNSYYHKPGVDALSACFWLLIAAAVSCAEPRLVTTLTSVDTCLSEINWNYNTMQIKTLLDKPFLHSLHLVTSTHPSSPTGMVSPWFANIWQGCLQVPTENKWEVAIIKRKQNKPHVSLSVIIILQTQHVYSSKAGGGKDPNTEEKKSDKVIGKIVKYFLKDKYSRRIKQDKNNRSLTWRRGTCRHGTCLDACLRQLGVTRRRFWNKTEWRDIKHMINCIPWVQRRHTLIAGFRPPVINCPWSGRGWQRRLQVTAMNPIRIISCN